MITRVVRRIEKMEIILCIRIQNRRLYTVQKIVRIGHQQSYVTAMLGDSIAMMKLVQYYFADIWHGQSDVYGA